MKFLTNGMICLLALCFCTQIQAQSWTDKTNTDGTPANFYDIQASFNAEWDGKEIVRSKGYKPYKRWEYHWETRVNDDGTFPDAGKTNREWESYLRAHPEAAAENMAANWTSLGPNSNTSGYAGTGRIGCVAFHPTNTNLYYIGSAAGGIWKTTNDGSSWTPLLDDQASIGVSSIVVDQASPNTIYIATGDGDGKDTYSIGVLKSTDGGTTWNTTGLTWNTSAADVIYRMIMDPNDANTLMVASNNGIYRTTDAGVSWNLEKSGNYYDIIAKPDAAATTFYATRYSSSTVYVDRSTDNGDNWTQTYSTGGRRGAFGVSANNSSYVYLLVANTSNGFGGMYRSTDSGVTFTQQSNSPNILTHSATGTGTGGQGWYDLCATADPLDANTIYIGGVNCWKSTDGGVNWTLKSHWSSTNGGSNQVVHADKHALFWQNNTTLFEGNDGGVYKTTNGGNTWTDVTSNLVISQMYKIGVSQTDSKVIIGLQDNGTKLRSTAGNWSDEIGGDGMECAINPTNSNIMYGELYYGAIRRSTNGGSSWTGITSSLPDGAWVTPFALDPNTPSTIYVGIQDLYKSTNQGTSWTSIASTTSSDLRHVVIAPSNSNYIYIGTTSSFWRTTDGGTTWNSITAPNSSITYLAVSPTDPNTVYATRGSFSNGNKVYKSTNGGSSWTNISGSLPNIPANTIVYQANSSEGLYVGMDVGIYYRDNTMSDWVLYNTNLPNAPVSELEINYSTNKIVAGTYGRGLWQSDLYAVNSDYITLTPSSLSVGGAGSSETVAVSANVSWTATSNDAWITVTPTSGTNDGTLTLTVAANPNCSPRTGSVTVSDGTISTNVTVDQALGGTAVPAPFTESFDVTTIPGCWAMSGVEDWLFDTSWPAYGASGVADNTGNGGSFAGVDGSGTNGSDTQLETPFIDLAALTTPTLSFYVFSNNTDTPGDNADLHVEVYDGTTWTNELTYAADNANWVHQLVDLSAYSGTIKVRFTIDHTVMTADQYHNDVVIDDVSVANAPAGCTGTPNGGTATGPSGSVCTGDNFDITISGQDLGVGISQQWESSTDNITWTPIVGQTGNTLTTSVTVTTYFRLNVNCSSSGLSGYSNTVMITPAFAFTAPFTESFDATSIPGCWVMSGVEDWLFDTGWPAYGASGVAENTGNGGSFAGVDGSGTNGSDTQLETPSIDISALTSPFLSFYVFSNNTNSPGDNADLHVEVYDGTTWTNELTYSDDNANWVQQFVDLSAYSGTIKIRFTIDYTVMANNQYHNDVIIDDVSVDNAAGCTGTPNGGTATGPGSAPCSGADFDVVASGQDIGAGISQQWESSADNVTWAPIVGQTGNTLTTSVTAATYLRLAVNCSTNGLTGYSNGVLVTPFMDACLCSCVSNATNTADTKIDTISFNGIAFGSDPSTCETFTDHTSTGLTFAPGETINMVVRNGSCSGSHYSAYLGVFADWNGDGDFEDANEDLHGSLETTALNTLAPFSFDVPAGQADGTVKIRFVLNESATPPTACGTFTYGETEDFCVDIIDPSSCTPDLLTGVSALVLDSTKASVIWDVTPEAGFFKIQYRVKGTSTWTLINVPNKDYQRVAWIISGLTKNTTYEYRARKQCPDLGVGPYTSIQEFTTFTTSPCEIPANSKISFLSTPDKVRIFLDYEPTAERYDVRWRVDGTTGPIENKVFKKSITVLSGLTPSTTYEYRVRTKCSGVWTGYSAWIDFTTNAIAPIVAPIAASRGDMLSAKGASNLVLYPNPVTQTLYIECEGVGSKHLRMMDMSGRVVLDQFVQDNLEVLDVAKYPQGTYFMQVIFENGDVVTQKLIKQ